MTKPKENCVFNICSTVWKGKHIKHIQLKSNLISSGTILFWQQTSHRQLYWYV